MKKILIIEDDDTILTEPETLQSAAATCGGSPTL